MPPALLLISGCLLVCLWAGLRFFVRQPKFGCLPEGARLERLKKSPHYADGAFRNLIPTPQLTEGATFAGVIFRHLTLPKKKLIPASPPPFIKTHLLAPDGDTDRIVWLGHSSLFMQLGGKTILIDPVFSGHAAPVSFSTRAFTGAAPYQAEDMPDIDCLIISHDHWDHLDYPTLTALRRKTASVVCGLGVGAHLERWGFAEERIREADWFTRLDLGDGLAVHVLPSRHFSGRWLRANTSLWTACAVETRRRRVFYSGDSGYGPHFADIGKRFPGFDLAILDTGQYDASWKYIHMTPEEAVEAAEDLGAKALLPVHVGRFAIAAHAWDEPLRRVAAASRTRNFRLLTPMIGECVDLDDETRTFTRWWEEME